MTRNNRNHLRSRRRKRHTGAARGGGVLRNGLLRGGFFRNGLFPDGPLREGLSRGGLLARSALLALAVLVPVSIFAVWTTFGKGKKPEKDSASSAAYATANPTRELAPTAAAEVSVQGISITGLSRADAKESLLAAFPWAMTLEYENEHFPIPDQLEPEIDRILEKIYSSPAAGPRSESFDFESVRQSSAEAARAFADQFNRSPEDSQLVSYDRETGKYQYSKEVSGLELNQDALTEAIVAAAKSGDYAAVITPSFTITPPSRNQAQAKEQYQVIGTFTTKTTNNKNRNQNIRLAVDAIDGRILKPGEEFSFNLSTGNRTSEKGYQPAGAYKNGVLIEEPGGGVCQVSTTLYHAIINSGFMTTERNSHSFAPSYVEPGQDAMVSFDGYAGPDLKFVNTSSASIALRAAFKDNQLKLSIVGLPVLEDGVKVSIRSEQVGETAPPEPTVSENPALPYGTQKEVESAKPGTSWKSFRILTKDGQVIEEKPLHSSNYRAKAAVIEQNTTVVGENGGVENSQTENGGGNSQTENSGGNTSSGNAGETGAPVNSGTNLEENAGGTGAPEIGDGNIQAGNAGITGAPEDTDAAGTPENSGSAPEAPSPSPILPFGSTAPGTASASAGPGQNS